MRSVTNLWRRSWRAVAAALLLVIGVHAAVPVGQPLSRQSGSAFSAATADVSLSQQRRGEVAKRALLPGPAPGEMPPTLADSRGAGPDKAFARIYRATGPPLAAITFSPLLSRAPPSA